MSAGLSSSQWHGLQAVCADSPQCPGAASPRPKREIVAPREETKILQRICETES
jgi:hypothetical protein